MSVHYAAWAVSYFMASMTTVVASEVRSVTYTTTRHLTPSGFDDWTVRLSTRLSSAIGCARQCARQMECVQFQWDDGLCHLNADKCHGFCAILHTPGCRPPNKMDDIGKIMELTTEGHCYRLTDNSHHCLTSFDGTVTSICRNGRLEILRRKPRVQCLVFNFTEWKPGHFTAQLVGIDLFLLPNANASSRMMAVKVEETDSGLVDFKQRPKFSVNRHVHEVIVRNNGMNQWISWFFYRYKKCE